MNLWLGAAAPAPLPAAATAHRQSSSPALPVEETVVRLQLPLGQNMAAAAVRDGSNRGSSMVRR